MLALSLTLLCAPVHSVFARAYSDSEIRQVEMGNESKIREIRDQEITQLRIALGRRSPVNRRADLYFRLAEIYIEAYRMTFLLEGRVHENRLAANQEDKFIDRTHSKPFLELAIRSSKDVLSLKIPYNKLDQIYYFLGFSSAELGKKKDSLSYFDQLTRQFPNSPFVGEAYRELGDAAFGSGQHKKAQAYYEIALKKSPAEMAPRIHHKLAWSYYRVKQYDRAVATMREAIDSASRSGEKFLSLREEALRDMAVFMTESGKVDEAIAYFQSVAGDKSFYPKVLERLGKQYERNVEPVKATLVYESLLKTNPGTDGAFRVLVKLVDLDLRRGRYMEALSRLKEAKISEGGDSETQIAAQNLRAMIRRTATEHHEKYRKKHQRNELEIAEAFYAVYLKTFLSKEDPRGETPEIEMYLAEVKRDLGKSREASDLYRHVVGSKDKRYAKEAGALWTASLAEAVKKSEQGSKAGSSGVKPGEPSELEKQYIEAADRLQEALEDTPEAREAALRAAQVLAGYKNTQKDSIKRIRKMLSNWPRTTQSLTAARLWLQLQADPVPPANASAAALEAASGAADDLADVIKELRKNSTLMTADQESGAGKLKAALVEQELRLKVFAIAGDEKDRDFAAAAKGYEMLAAESNQTDFSEKAFENAVAAYGKASDFVSQERVISSWLKRFPKSARVRDSIRGVASTQLVQGRFELSARLFEKAGREGGDPNSLETAARIYEGIGDLPRAQGIWAVLLEQNPKAANRGKIALALAASYENSQKNGEAAKVYQVCMSGAPDYEAACGAQLADLYAKDGNLEQAKATYKKVAGHGKSDATSSFVGYARYRLAEYLETSTRFEPLQLPDAQLKKAMNQRLTFLDSLSKAYQSAVEAGGPWAIAALERLATWVYRFAEEMDAIPIPAGADPQAAAKFRKGLESVSGPLRKKAISTWLEGYNKALAVELLSPALPALADHLADAKAPQPGRAQGFRGKMRLAGIPADGGNDGRATALQKVRERLLKNPEDIAAWVDYGNLLWGENKPLLAKLAYDRALGLTGSSKKPTKTSVTSMALNNRAVLELRGTGQEDWLNVAEAAQLFVAAQKADEFFLPTRYNRGVLLNYYRLFARAKPVWEQVSAKDGSAEVLAAYAIALQGLGEMTQADEKFRKAIGRGLKDSDFVSFYHEAARESVKGAAGAAKCISVLEDSDTVLIGFEKSAKERLKGVCRVWNGSK
ncbi:MAG: hypothetical protein A2070_14665 [Bdellovibrionales bacterium GWC1_52_8]|nr:MAG: hypothetical protein A2X97_15265 [Bdellovibrionales bacterium GWA1_52_35]OFZ33290.1 MAG: hypothetical protein A2070_14665 [Bdellovibrionales bacterium GWC1_52_8]